MMETCKHCKYPLIGIYVGIKWAYQTDPIVHVFYCRNCGKPFKAIHENNTMISDDSLMEMFE